MVHQNWKNIFDTLMRHGASAFGFHKKWTSAISSFFLLSEPENKSKNLVYTKGYGSLKMVNRFSSFTQKIMTLVKLWEPANRYIFQKALTVHYHSTIFHASNISLSRDMGRGQKWHATDKKPKKHEANRLQNGKIHTIILIVQLTYIILIF